MCALGAAAIPLRDDVHAVVVVERLEAPRACGFGVGGGGGGFLFPTGAFLGGQWLFSPRFFGHLPPRWDSHR